ncbi:acetolactate synthase 2 small subunit [Alkalimonas collagenimarina]|uniref:Acetolactate synthase 2 small subunit n=1 Tax=Alkalimonas collagenimarina TaxID=400390 RepID=A0ABT9GY25_9GAMM|nr:acetolactate synthase 2 small subunit [Alkalimonas collagenimarina]MDP4535947.1 acetolactate synthase 2 small subunit [Alkalimonas collagenimarina]
MNHVLTIQTRNQAVVLERLLQVTRYRGFQLAGLEMKPLAEHAGLLIILSVVTDKPIHLLTNQLNKLVDVEQLELASETLTALRA